MDRKGQSNLGAFVVGAAIAMLIGVALLPNLGALLDQAEFISGDNRNTTNVSGATLALIKLVPILFVAALVLGAMAFFKRRA